MTSDSDIGRIVRERIRVAYRNGYAVLELSKMTGLSTNVVMRIVKAGKRDEPKGAA